MTCVALSMLSKYPQKQVSKTCQMLAALSLDGTETYLVTTFQISAPISPKISQGSEFTSQALPTSPESTTNLCDLKESGRPNKALALYVSANDLSGHGWICTFHVYHFNISTIQCQSCVNDMYLSLLWEKVVRFSICQHETTGFGHWFRALDTWARRVCHRMERFLVLHSPLWWKFYSLLEDVEQNPSTVRRWVTMTDFNLSSGLEEVVLCTQHFLTPNLSDPTAWSVALKA